MMKALLRASAAALIALAPLCIPPAQAHADDDPCVSITDPAAHQACIDDFVQRREKTQCDASSNHGQVGQLCG
jgi:hypothetical protein